MSMCKASVEPVLLIANYHKLTSFHAQLVDCGVICTGTCSIKET